MLFLPSALNVKVNKFNQAQVNNESNCDSLKVIKWELTIENMSWV